MKKMSTLEKVLVFDGGLGTMLLEKGLEAGSSPELLNLKNPQAIEEVHLGYLNAGADVITTNTFGGNRLKLAEYGLQQQIKEINAAGVKIARKVADKFNRYVAASVGPTGEFMEPMGKLTFKEMYQIFKEQITALIEEKPDFIILETFHDLGEIRVALLAARDICNIPVICSLTFEGNRTLTGASPTSAAVVLESLGASAIGANCSGGPTSLFKVVEEMANNTSLPVIVQPNAGLPQWKGDKAVYSLEPDGFIQELEPYFHIGVNIFGSCCGSTPQHTKAIKERLREHRVTSKPALKAGSFASRGQTVFVGENTLPLIVGERINPTGRKDLANALRNEEFGLLQSEAEIQVESGAHILDINVGTHNIDEKETMSKFINLLQQKIDIPLCIDSTNPDVIERALQIYHGKALVNSINGEKSVYEKILPIVKRYGAGVVALTLDSEGIPERAEERYEIAKQIVKACDEYGIPRRDIYIDCLALTIGIDDKSALETIKALKMVKEGLGVKTILGVSNVSHGLPSRHKIDTTFLAVAIANGLDLAIIDPLDKDMINTWQAASLIAGRDKKAKNYIESNSIKNPEKSDYKKNFRNKDADGTSLEMLKDLITRGSYDIVTALEELLNKDIKPLDIINEGLIPGLEIVGEKFQTGEFFLPELILSAEVAQMAFQYLEKQMENTEDIKKKATIVIGAVQGDIHDIGKNIVAIILKNYGYNVIDLGKDVSAETFLEVAKRENADFVGLSALMTTTMMEIPRTIDYVKDQLPNIKFIVGGAVVTEEFAKESGADGYSKDAVSAAKLLEKLQSN